MKLSPSRRASAVCASAALALTALGVAAAPAALASPNYTNCTSLHKTYAHGVGRNDARDKTSGTPVTTFKHDTAAYKRAIAANSRLDADHDGIACEKR